MAPSAEEINNLIASGPKKSSIPQLEAFLDAQMSGAEAYHGKAVRTLIKSYQLFCAGNTEKITQACFLALLEFPSSDLLALNYMIPTATQKTEPLATIFVCQKQLVACQFAAFWKTYGTLQTADPIANLTKSSVARLQSAILSVLMRTYQTAPLSVVLEALNTSNVGDIKGATVNGDGPLNSLLICPVLHSRAHHRNRGFC